MLADGTRFRILHFVRDRCCERNHCVRAIGPDVDVGRCWVKGEGGDGPGSRANNGAVMGVGLVLGNGLRWGSVLWASYAVVPRARAYAQVGG